MNPEWETAVRVALGAVPALATVAGLLQGPGARRTRLKRDVELLGNLPAESAAHRSMLQWIDSQINELKTFETNASRDWTGLGIAVVLSVVFGYLTYFLLARGEWWEILLATVSGVLTAAMVFMTFDSAQLARRNEKGNRIPAPAGEE